MYFIIFVKQRFSIFTGKSEIALHNYVLIIYGHRRVLASDLRVNGTLGQHTGKKNIISLQLLLRIPY